MPIVIYVSYHCFNCYELSDKRLRNYRLNARVLLFIYADFHVRTSVKQSNANGNVVHEFLWQLLAVSALLASCWSPGS